MKSKELIGVFTVGIGMDSGKITRHSDKRKYGSNPDHFDEGD